MFCREQYREVFYETNNARHVIVSTILFCRQVNKTLRHHKKSFPVVCLYQTSIFSIFFKPEINVTRLTIHKSLSEEHTTVSSSEVSLSCSSPGSEGLFLQQSITQEQDLSQGVFCFWHEQLPPMHPVSLLEH